MLIKWLEIALKYFIFWEVNTIFTSAWLYLLSVDFKVTLHPNNPYSLKNKVETLIASESVLHSILKVEVIS